MTTIATDIGQKELPAGWKWVKLGDVSSINYGFTASADFNVGGPRFVRITDIKDGQVDWESVPSCTLTPEDEQKHLLRTGDLLFARTGGTTGKSFLVKNPPSAVYASYLLRVRLNSESLPEYMAHYFNSDSYWSYVGSTVRGGAQPNINAQLLGTLPIPLPPLGEQKRIAGILNEQMAAVEEAKKAAQERLEAAKALPSAYLREVFEGEEAQGWEISPLSESFELQTGFAFKSHWFKETGIRLLRNANVMPQTIDWSNVVHLSEKMADDYSRFDLNQGDIVLSLDRPLVSAGLKVARITSEDLPAILVQRVGRFISKKTANEDFLYLFLNSDTFIRQITGHDQSVGVPHISPKQVMSVVMPLPDVAKQTQITKWLDDKSFAASIAEASIQQELDTIEAMPAALLRKAFSGAL